MLRMSLTKKVFIYTKRLSKSRKDLGLLGLDLVRSTSAPFYSVKSGWGADLFGLGQVAPISGRFSSSNVRLESGPLGSTHGVIGFNQVQVQSRRLLLVLARI